MSAVLFICLASTPFAHAASVYKAPLTDFHMDPALNLSPRLGPGMVTVDTGRRTVRVEIVQHFYCPPHRACIESMPEPVVVEASLAKKHIDSCNIAVFEAVADQTRENGLRQVIQVRDNSRNNCPTFIALPAVEVIYTTEDSWTRERTYSRMTGPEPLQR